MITPGGSISYDIKVIKSQQYTMEEIFEKKLLFLIPFYIFSHEAKFQEYEQDERKLKILKLEYEQIKNKLEKLAEGHIIDEYTKCTIMDMSNKVLQHIAQKYASVKEGVKFVMGGKILEYEAKTIKKEGIKEGTKKERKEGIRTLIDSLRSFSIPDETIIDQLIQRYPLTKEEAISFVKNR